MSDLGETHTDRKLNSRRRRPHQPCDCSCHGIGKTDVRRRRLAAAPSSAFKCTMMYRPGDLTFSRCDYDVTELPIYSLMAFLSLGEEFLPTPVMVHPYPPSNSVVQRHKKSRSKNKINDLEQKTASSRKKLMS